MGYKIPDLPSAKAYIEEKADFWEVQALKNNGNSVAQISIAKAISRGLDEISVEGLLDEDDELDDTLESVFKELDRREGDCRKGYPFKLGTYSLRYNTAVPENFRIVYLFLLLCTRFRMDKNKIQNDIDGTLLFEKLSAEVAKNYIGESANSWVFGTATRGNFESKVENLVKLIGEGDGYKNPDNSYPKKNDDGIDVVVWKDFADKRRGKLIGFGQCKTGTTWQDEIKKLNPRRFCDNWLKDNPIVAPIPMVFLCDTLNWERNFVSDQRNFLIFNRFRIMEYLPNDLDQEILSDIKAWTGAALATL